MAEHLFGCLLAGRPEHRRPQRRVEAGDVLADEVDVGGPVLVERRPVVAVADAGDVGQQGVEPDVDGEPLVERHADAPVLAGAGDVDVAQPVVLDQADDLVAARLRLNEVGMLREVLQEPVLKGGQAEEVALLGAVRQRPLMVGTQPVVFGVLLVGLELLAAVAVPALVATLVDVAVVVDLLDEGAAALLVPLVTGLDEDVGADAQGVPDLAELPGHVVAVLLRLLPQLGGPLRHLDGVLVRPHQEKDVITLHAPVACLHVGADLLEGGADVRPAVGVVDGGGQVKACRVGHRATILRCGLVTTKGDGFSFLIAGPRRQGTGSTPVRKTNAGEACLSCVAMARGRPLRRRRADAGRPAPRAPGRSGSAPC